MNDALDKIRAEYNANNENPQERLHEEKKNWTHPPSIPHNPMINAGAIMTCSLVRNDWNFAARFEFAEEQWNRLCGKGVVGNISFSNATYLSESATADRNHCLGYFMQEAGAFPEGVSLKETLEFYFMMCSLEATAEMMSVVASTLANGGINPITGDRVYNERTVANCLSLMFSCGMYDNSGDFAFKMGFPAKSGVGGAIMTVIPGLCGFCTFSPRLNEIGNSVRGCEFFERLAQEYAFHNYSIRADRELSLHDDSM
jgi:glutaminase